MSWTIDRITAKCAEFSAMVGDTYEWTPQPYFGRVIMGTERGIAKMEFSKEFLNSKRHRSRVGALLYHEDYYKHDQEFKKVCALIGYTNSKARTEVERTVEPESLYKYIVRCPDCNSTIGMH